MVTGSLLLAGLGLYQAITSKVVVGWLYGTIAFAFLVWAFFGTWSKSNKRLQAAEGCINGYRNRAIELTLISSHLAAGNALAINAPGDKATEEEIADWKRRIDSWRMVTSDVLGSISPIATDKMYRRRKDDGELYYGVHQSVWSDLALLNEKLESITEIMEKPDTYLAKI